VLLNPPIDNGCLYKCFYHNPAAFDPDGDSLAYSLDTCLGYGGLEVLGYSIPTPGPNGQIYVNPITGDFVWCSPQPDPNNSSFPQEYNFAIYIKEYRKLNGQWYLIGFVERDLQVDIDNCLNNPPVIADVQDTCVLAGDTLNFTVFAYDPDSQFVTLSASGGPMNSSFFTPPASFLDTGGLSPVDGQSHVTGIFSWATNCNMVRNQPYQVVFKAVDSDPQNQLIDIETVFIRIVAPPPQNLTATPDCDRMKLSWTPPVCNPSPNYITGYRIYRLDSCDTWVHSNCETGVPSYTGYVLVGTVSGVNTITFTDDNGGTGLSNGVNYAYHVVAVMVDGAESYASNKVCRSLVRDVPVMTHVDVTSTSQTTGTIDVKWAPPIAGAGNLDTITSPGPYIYRIYKKSGFTGANIWVATLTAPNFLGSNGISSFTSFTDIAPNTDGSPYVYNVQMLAAGGSDSLCRAKEASSVYLTLVPNDNRIALNWASVVPWTNYKYHIYRSIPSLSIPFTLIDSTTAVMYTDSNLANGRQYCYKIKAYGQYSDTSIVRPLINWSEEKCAVPVDLTPPCCPVLNIISDCNNNSNTLTWTNPNASCTDGTDDVVSYNVYYTPVEGEDMNLLANVSDANTTFYLDDSLNSIAGCYQVVAVDSFGNQSSSCNMVCVDNCPIYDLPNVFTPNGDGINDFFIPFPYKYVKDIDLHIYNRWGQIVFSTTDPDINWDGTDQTSKKLLSDGVYFYVCIVNEIRLKGIQPRPLKGFVQLLQHKQ
jgi:gliding motility-associated-like protein